MQIWCLNSRVQWSIRNRTWNGGSTEKRPRMHVKGIPQGIEKNIANLNGIAKGLRILLELMCVGGEFICALKT